MRCYHHLIYHANTVELHCIYDVYYMMIIIVLNSYYSNIFRMLHVCMLQTINKRLKKATTVFYFRCEDSARAPVF